MPRWAEDDFWPGGANRSNSPRQLSSFADRFVHLRTGNPAADKPALLAAVLADGTNLGLARMADASRGLGYHHLVNVAQWHISDDNYVAARAAIVNAHHRHPMAAIWDDGTTSSSDGQYFRAGGRAGPGGSVNAKYGIDPGAVLYTHVSGHYGPFYTRVISATMSEAPYVLDGLHHHAHQGIVRVNSILPACASERSGAPLFLLINRRRARSGSTPKMAYTYLP